MQRWQEINSSLQQAGVEVGPVQVNPIALEKTDQASCVARTKTIQPPHPLFLCSTESRTLSNKSPMNGFWYSMGVGSRIVFSVKMA